MPSLEKLSSSVQACFQSSFFGGKSVGRRPKRCLNSWLAFIGGCALGQIYYFYLLKKIPFSDHLGVIISVVLSLFLGVCNVVCAQLRCISLLTLPMYCGKPGRGVVKAVVLTYVIAGPIANMGLNAKEVVRVFACSTHLSQNLSSAKYTILGPPFKKAVFQLRPEISQIKDTVRSIRDVITPIETEVEEPSRLYYDINMTQNHRRKLGKLEHETKPKDVYQNMYLKKLDRRCEYQLEHAVTYCMDVFATAYNHSKVDLPTKSAWALSWPVAKQICDVKEAVGDPNICDSKKETNPGLGEGYACLKRARNILANNRDVSLQYKLNIVRELYDIQNAKETGDRVMHAFEEKYIIMHSVTVIVNICVALMFLRIFTAAVSYHDLYLTDIEHDNIYITGYFKKIDRRRRAKNQYTLLPFKKMERNKYIDVYSLKYRSSERKKLVTHILKVMLEVITATTFVMLDRLFFEALDVVRQHAEIETPGEGTRDLEIEVEGTGDFPNIVRKVLNTLNEKEIVKRSVTNKFCVPQPRIMSPTFYLKIYGGYLWILLLLYINPYTMRLKRLICSYFYQNREKQRILHLYNDILKKRMKMQKTLRRKAVQAVRAHYLSGENLLSLRIKFPRLLGWLRILPAARMTCLICGETEPREHDRDENVDGESWHSCTLSKCPFVYCMECWREVGARCLACDPSLAELSDVDSLSEDELKLKMSD